MKKILLLIINFLYFISAQNINNLALLKNIGGSEDDSGYSIKKTSDNGYILLGVSKSSNGDINNNHGKEDIVLIKLDQNENIVWQKSYGGSESESITTPKTLQITPDGGFIFVAFTNSNDGDVIRDLSIPITEATKWVVKLDAQGNIQWQNSLMTNSGSSIQVIPNEGYVIGGVKGLGFSLTKLDLNGNILWEKSYPNYTISELSDIDMTAHNSGFILIGSNKQSAATSEIRILNVNQNGDIIWEKFYKYQNYYARNYASRVLVNSDSTFLITGMIRQTSYTGNTNGLLLKLDSFGNTIWAKEFVSYVDSNLDIKSSIITQNNEYVLCGRRDDPYPYDDNDFWFGKFDINGNLIDQQIIRGNSYDVAYDIVENNNNQFDILGISDSGFLGYWVQVYPPQFLIQQYLNYKGKTDIVLLKLNNITSLKTNEVTNNIKFNIYPNPTKNILYINSDKNISKINVFSIDGRLIQEKEEGNIKSINVSNLENGNYVIEIINSDRSKGSMKFIKN